MTHLTEDDLERMVAETIEAASRAEHPWDQRALDWPLSPTSVVVDVGGFKGRWSRQIADRYGPRIYLFEPQHWACTVARQVLKGKNTSVLGAALGTHTTYLQMTRWETDGCTFVNADPNEANGGWLHEAGEAFRTLEIGPVDLMMMNIEGYEYQLIPHLLQCEIYPHYLAVQFHTFADPSGVLTGYVYNQLAKAGYSVLWTYGAVLTAWERL